MKIPLILCPGFPKSGTTTFAKKLRTKKQAFFHSKEPNYFGRNTVDYNLKVRREYEKTIRRYNLFNSYNIKTLDNLYNEDIKISTEIYYEYMKELWEYAKFYDYPYLFDGSQNYTALTLREDQKENQREFFRLNEFFDVKCVIFLRHPIWRAWSLANMIHTKYGLDIHEPYDSYQSSKYEYVVTTFENNFDTLVLTYEDLYFNRIEESNQRLSKFLNLDYTPTNKWRNVGVYGSRKLSKERYNKGLILYKDDFDFGEKYFGYQPWEK